VKRQAAVKKDLAMLTTNLTTNGTATFTMMNGPRKGESIEIPLGKLADALSKTTCPSEPNTFIK
jgi:hypothetical protein